MALRTALSAKQADGKLVILDEVKLKDGKTKQLIEKFDKLGLANALIVAGVAVDELADEDLPALWDRAAPLTVTERRFATADGDAWLAQAFGPAWGEGAAAGAVGVRVTCLTSERPIRTAAGVRIGDMDDAALADVATGAAPAAAHIEE